MSRSATNSNRKRRVMIEAAVGLLVLTIFVSAAWYLTSSRFRDWARASLVLRLENMTGGRVEIGDLKWNLSKLEFDIHDITIHGLESANDVPYAHADRLLIRAKILSFLRRDIGLRWLQIDRPVVHLIVYPDGHTNQPVPKAVAKAEGNAVQQLFAMDVKHAEANGGTLILNQHRWPLDFSIDDLHAAMEHVSGSAPRYDGKLLLGALNARYADLLPANARADLQFELYPDRLEVTGLHLLSGRSQLDASGRLIDFRNPAVDATYRATLDCAEVARTTRLRQLRGGLVDVQGAAKWEKGQIASAGKLVVHGLDYQAGEVRLRNLDAASDFTIDSRTLDLTHVVGRVFGGIIRGRIAIVNWAGKGNDSPPAGVARLSIDSLPVGAVAEAVSTRKFDLGRLGLAGNGHGRVEARWRGSASRMIADLDIAVDPPPQPSSAQWPVRGQLRGSYDMAARKLTAAILNIETPDARASASGVLGSATEGLNLTLTVQDLRRMQPMFTLLKAPESVAGLAGQLRFQGKIGGKLGSEYLQGRLDLADFSFLTVAVITPTGNEQPPRFHLDSATADVTYSQQAILVRNGTARRGGAQVNFDLSAGLDSGAIAGNSPVAAHLVMRGADLEDLQAIAGYRYPVSGTVAATLNLSGTKNHPEGNGRLQLSNGSVYGEPVKSAAADLRLQRDVLQVGNLLIVHNGARISGSGNYNLQTTAFHFQTSGANFQLSTIKRLMTAKLSLAGVASFNATGSGTTNAPIINATARLQNLVVNGARVGDATLTAITEGDTLKLTSRSNFQNAQLTADGTIKVRDPMFPANLKVHFDNFDFMPFLQAALLNNVSAKSYAGGDVTLRGPLRRPQELVMSAEILVLRADMQGIELHNTEPIRVNMANAVARIESFHLIGLDTEMTASGTVDLNGNRRIRVRANGRLNLQLARSFAPDINSSGMVHFNLSVGGVLARPTLQGEVRVVNGAVNLVDFPNGLSNINGTLLFSENRVEVQSLAAHTGGGDIIIGGFATGPRLNFNLTAHGHDIRLRYPQGVSSTANIDLKLTGSLNNSTLSGDVTITRFGFNNQFDLALYLARSSRPADLPVASPLNNLHLNLHVVSTPELQVQSSLAKLAGNVDLRVRGTGTNPVVLGRVNLTEGQFSFNGQTYLMERGDVTFNNPTKTEPTLDIEATTRVRDYDLTVHLAGQPTNGLKPTFRSDPPLPEADIINLLAFGRTREEAEIANTQTNTTYTDTVSNAVLGQAINQTLSNRVQKLFGVSRIKISPELGSTQTNPSAQLTVEQQVSNKVTITYISNLTQASQQGIFVEYNINRDVSIVGGRDQYGVVSFDIHVRQRKR
jgi:translocation and assembly module TamB